MLPRLETSSFWTGPRGRLLGLGGTHSWASQLLDQIRFDCDLSLRGEEDWYRLSRAVLERSISGRRLVLPNLRTGSGSANLRLDPVERPKPRAVEGFVEILRFLLSEVRHLSDSPVAAKVIRDPGPHAYGWCAEVTRQDRDGVPSYTFYKGSYTLCFSFDPLNYGEVLIGSGLYLRDSDEGAMIYVRVRGRGRDGVKMAKQVATFSTWRQDLERPSSQVAAQILFDRLTSLLRRVPKGLEPDKVEVSQGRKTMVASVAALNGPNYLRDLMGGRPPRVISLTAVTGIGYPLASVGYHSGRYAFGIYDRLPKGDEQTEKLTGLWLQSRNVPIP